MNNQKIILVFGLPGVGKTTLINNAIKENGSFLRLSGGTLINNSLLEKERDQLRQHSASEIISNQNSLVENFHIERLKYPDKNIIFDGHCIVKNKNESVIIPVDIIKRLLPNYLVFIDEYTEIISARRKADLSRPDREVEDLNKLSQDRQSQLLLCNKYSKELNIPLALFKSSEKLKFIEFISAT